MLASLSDASYLIACITSTTGSSLENSFSITHKKNKTRFCDLFVPQTSFVFCFFFFSFFVLYGCDRGSFIK